MLCAQQQSSSAVADAVNAGEALQKKGDYPGALERFRWCEAYAKDHAATADQAVCVQLIGGIERLQGEYAASEMHYREALALARQAGDTRRVGYILNNLANLFGAQSRYPETIAMLQEAIATGKQAGNTEDPAPLQNLAITYALQGDHARALETFLLALKIYEKLGQKNKIALVHYNMGVLSLKQGNYTAAKREFEEAMARADGDQYVTTQALNDLGRVQDAEGHPAEALSTFQKALGICQKSGFKTCIAECQMNIGNFHLGHKEPGQATKAFLSALEIFEPLHDTYNSGISLRGLGYAARLQSDSQSAADYANRAAALSREIGDPDGEWQALGLFGLAASDAGKQTEARAAYQQAIAIIEKQRGKVGGGETEQQRFFEKALFPYQQLAFLEAEAGNPLGSLLTAETARSRVLLDMLAAPPEQIGRNMTEAERQEEAQLLGAIAGTNASLARASAANKPALKAKYEAAWGKYESFRAALYARHPEVKIARGQTSPLQVQDLAELLPDHQSAILEFVSAQEKTLLIVARRGDDPAHPVISTFPIAIAKDALTKRISAFHSKLEARDPGFQADARALYRLLLEPGSAALAGKTKWLLVADGPLWEMPFQALVDRSGKYILETRALTWAPSLTFARDQLHRAPNAVATLDLVAFADPASTGFPSVADLREQVRSVAALYPPDRTVVRVGASASEEAFREFAPRAKVIHLATHGISDLNNSLRSRLLLASSGTTGATSRDGSLEAWELMRLDLKADVAVLSACESGRGSATGGEGLVGLTWSLFAAGVRQAAVSQWSVESGSTSLLMTEVHKRLRRGESLAPALRGGMLSIMKDPRYKHPFYWGAFIAAGNGAITR